MSHSSCENVKGLVIHKYCQTTLETSKTCYITEHSIFICLGNLKIFPCVNYKISAYEGL